ncbi:Equilibrative nucleotide transporter 2 [Glycine soja]|uniref:Equilibrative nucleotide transporter 2 n=1 Tax=Glycine soja TaxID=3848 RepID=A0A445GX21_GLYSO|nr:Equilibrative nucleotide transporter 2 [Glycine soja]
MLRIFVPLQESPPSTAEELTLLLTPRTYYHQLRNVVEDAFRYAPCFRHDAYVQGGMVGDLSYMKLEFIQSFLAGVAASDALTSALRLITKTTFENSKDVLCKGASKFNSPEEEGFVMEIGESALLTTTCGKNKATKPQANQKGDGYAKPKETSGKSKGYRFYSPYDITSRYAKFLENDLISRSDQLRYLGSEIDHIESQPSTSSERLVVIHTPQVQRDDEQQMTSIPQPVANNPVDQVDYQIPENDEQPVEQHDPQENVDVALKRSTRVRKLVIPSDYIVYLQESDYNIRVENDLETFDLAMSYKESNLWYNAIKDEMNSMQSNIV